MKRHFIAVIFIIFVSFLFTWKLFFPELRLIATPEFELHDGIQLSYASKWWYFQKLHQFQLPIWSNQIGGGFPMLGEGQTGIFFLPNVIIGGLIQNPVLAYNLLLTLVPVTAAFGMYVWFILLGLPWEISILAGLTTALSGFTVFHLQHISLLQGFSLIPLLMTSTLGMTRKEPKPWMFLFILVLSQQFCTGFTQAVVIGGMFSFFYYVFLIRKRAGQWKLLLLYLLATMGGVGVSAIQFLPSLEFLNQITSWERSNPDWPTQYSFPIRFLLTFIYPFVFGNPALGTFKGGSDPGLIFWENIGYVGILPLVLSAYGVWSKQIRKDTFFFAIAGIASLFLMLGKFSPFYFVFNFFPLNLFRVPSRFIYIFALCLILIAAKVSAFLIQNKPMYVRYIIVFLWLLNLSLLYPFWTAYHPLEAPSQIHEAPPITTIIPESSYTYRLNTTNSQRTRYFKYGSTDMKRYYFYKNTLMPNTNVFWNYTISDAYPSRFLKRPAILDGLFLAALHEDGKIATISATAKTILSLTPTDWIISGKPIDSNGSYTLKQTLGDDDGSLFIYLVPHATPWAFFPTSWRVLSALSDIGKIFQDPTFDPQHSVIVERKLSIEPENTSPVIENISQTDGIIQIDVEGIIKDSLFTIGETYYPGWIAKVDGKKTEIIPVNIRNMGIVVPKGTTHIEFQYVPKSLIWGVVISIASIIISIIFLLR
jgi:hypothetical protein